MPAELDALLTDLDLKFQQFYLQDFSSVNSYIVQLGDKILANDWVGAHNVCDYIAYQWTNTFRTGLAMSSGKIRPVIYNILNWIADNWSAGGTTMDDILNAMLGATHNQLEKFIGIEDAYRMALWNAPFNADFYAALGRGFAKWPEP